MKSVIIFLGPFFVSISSERIAQVWMRRENQHFKSKSWKKSLKSGPFENLWESYINSLSKITKFAPIANQF